MAGVPGGHGALDDSSAHQRVRSVTHDDIPHEQHTISVIKPVVCVVAHTEIVSAFVAIDRGDRICLRALKRALGFSAAVS